MEAIIIHPADTKQQEALITFLNGLHIPYEKEYADETERIMANPFMVEKLQQSKKDMEDKKGISIPLEDLWK